MKKNLFVVSGGQSNAVAELRFCDGALDVTLKSNGRKYRYVASYEDFRKVANAASMGRAYGELETPQRKTCIKVTTTTPTIGPKNGGGIVVYQRGWVPLVERLEAKSLGRKVRPVATVFKRAQGPVFG